MPDRLPETMTGAAFLGAHGGIFDTVTAVDPHETYPVRAAAEHAIYENARVHRFVDCLRDAGEAAFADAGEQMYGSHTSYSACRLGAAETDLLVEMASEMADVAGAKITGGGSGGTVCVLCRSGAEEEIAEALMDGYAHQSGNPPRLIRGTSPGAVQTDVRKIVG
jgi:L-arabinokinase